MKAAVLALCLLGETAFAQDGAPAPPAAAAEAGLSIEEAQALALERNEALSAARLGIAPARAGIDVARQRPNPDFSFEEARETPHEAFSLAFPIETAGKRGSRIRAAEAGALAAEAELAQRVLEVRIETRRAFYALLAALRRVREGEAMHELAERVRGAAAERFEAGAAPRLEMLEAELAAVQAENEVLADRALTSTARSELNLLLALPPSNPTEVRGDLGDGELPSLDAASESALASSAEIALLDQRLLEQEARVALAEAQRWPDPVLEGTLTHRSPPEFDYGWRGLLTVNLPLFHHRAAEVRVEEGSLARLRAEREAAVSRLRAGIHSGIELATSRREQYLRYRERILPRTDEVQAMAEDAYRSGQTGLPALIQALRAARELKLQAIEAGLAYQSARADLERALGAALP